MEELKKSDMGSTSGKLVREVQLATLLLTRMFKPLLVMNKHCPSSLQATLPELVEGMMPGNDREVRIVGVAWIFIAAQLSASFRGSDEAKA